jgi:3-oxoacyl-[acyl-carrier protein] reductase
MRSVIVTGASRGLGLAIARRLLAGGYRVLAVARRDSEPLAALRTGGALCFLPFDLSDIDGIPEFVRAARRRHGPIYGLVNNAAAGPHGVLAMMRTAEIESTIRLNTVSPLVLTRHVVRAMMVDRGGRIVNIASIVAATGFAGLSVYGATKAALVGFTRSLAREVGEAGITVNAVAPGFIDTEMTRGLGPGERDRIVRRSPLRRLVEAEDVANAVAFLLDDASRHITGTVLTVDAGSTA